MMKKMIYMGSLALIVAIGLFWSCQKDETLTNPENGLNLKAASAPVVLLSSEDCSTICITEDGVSEPTVTTAEYNPSKNISVAVSNTATHLIFSFTSAEEIHYIKVGDNDAICSDEVSLTQPVIDMVQLPENWEACELITTSVTAYRNNCTGNGSGNAVTFDAPHTLIGICPPCEEILSYETTDNLSVVFTYVSEEALANAEVKLTCPHITGISGKDAELFTVNPGNGKGSPTVLTWTGDIDACTEYSWEITFTPDCEQNAAGFANIWTDFKVNGDSKKGELSNIIYNCPN